MVIYPIWLYNKWPRGLFSRSFPIYNDLQTSISNMASSNNDTSHYLQEWLWAFWKNTANRADRASISSIFVQSTFPSLSSFLFHLPQFFHPHFPSYTFHFSLSLIICLHLFSFTFILIHSFHPTSTFIHLHPLHLTPVAFIHGHLAPLAFFYLLFPLALIHLHPPDPLSSPSFSLLHRRL